MMTAASMRGRIKTAMDALGDPAEFPNPQAYATAAMEAMCAGIIQEIQLNAVVTATVAVPSVSGVTPGGGISGPGTGTATGTVS